METESRLSIIKEVGNWFGDLSDEFKDDSVFGFALRGMIAKLKQGEIPDRKLSKLATSPLRKDLGEVLRQLDNIRGYRVPKRSAEAASIQRMLKRNFTPEQIIDTWKTMKAEPFWSSKELFLMTVESQIGAMTIKKTGQDKYTHQKYSHMVQGISSDPDKYIKGKYGNVVRR